MRPAVDDEKDPNNRLFHDRPGREFVRAIAMFGVLVLALVALSLQLALREVSLKVLTEKLGLAQQEAQRIARIVDLIGKEKGGLDFSRIRERRAALRRYVHQEIADSVYIHHVEIRDRFGVRQLYVTRDPFRPHPVPRPGSAAIPEDWPDAVEQIVRVPVGRSEGEVRVGLSSEPVLEELRALRRSLRIKVAVAGGLALVLLLVGLGYVLHLIRKNRRLERARQSAARASYVGLLASGLAHEIRNPLNAMSMNLQMLEEELHDLDASETDSHELLDSTKSEIKRLERLVENFLAYARPAEPRFQSRDLNEVVGEVVRFLGGDFRQHRIGLVADFEPLLPTVELDETQFKQALMNLLVNARQVLPAGGTVKVQTRAGSGGEVVVEIIDDGPGIPEQAQPRIFEVFYSSRGGGTGLGLPIARQIVERHGGTIELQSEPGRGATFRIRLPRRHGSLTDRSAQGAER